MHLWVIWKQLNKEQDPISHVQHLWSQTAPIFFFQLFALLLIDSSLKAERFWISTAWWTRTAPPDKRQRATRGDESSVLRGPWKERAMAEVKENASCCSDFGAPPSEPKPLNGGETTSASIWNSDAWWSEINCCHKSSHKKGRLW